MRSEYDVNGGARARRPVRGRELMTLSISEADHTGSGDGEDARRRIFDACLSASRELAGLLGGELVVTSTPPGGDSFTVYLPPDLPTNAPRGAALGAIIASSLLAPTPRATLVPSGAVSDGG